MKSHPQQPATPPTADDALQGEGNYTATRRYRESVKTFIDSGKVDQAAHDAAPDTEQQARDMKNAEQVGKSHARR
jgi:hypothetical protein